MNDPHEREYAAAVSAMQDTYGVPAASLPADGDFVSGCTAGKHWSGRVEWIDGHMISLDVGGAWVRVPITDITH